MKTKTRFQGCLKWASFIVLSIFISFSCSKDEQNNEPEAFVPQIEILSPTSTDITVEPMELVVLNVVASTAPGSGEKIVQFKFTSQFEFEALKIVLDTILDTNTFSLTNYSIWAEPKIGTEVWTFEAKDESGDVTKKTITLALEGEIPELKPIITLKSGNHPGTGWVYVDGDVTLSVGAPFVFGFDATTNSLSNLKRIKVTRNYENISVNTILDSNFSMQTISFDIQTIAYPNTPGNEVFEITATDEDDNTNSISFTVTTLQQDPGINHFQNIQLGSYTSTITSPFSTATGLTYTFPQLQDPALQSKVDWVYFHGATYGHTLMSPANNDIYGIYPDIENWENKKTTLFIKTNLTVSQFNSIENKNQLILTWTNNGINPTTNFYSELLSSPGGLAPNDIIAFETQAAKYGFLRIVEINSAPQNGNSTIKFDIKVAK